jgi:murein DD-endopeptidase MepM/ murein hydrolase activator NlpD
VDSFAFSEVAVLRSATQATAWRIGDRGADRGSGIADRGSRSEKQLRWETSIGRLLVRYALLLAVTSCSIPRWPVEATATSPYGLRLRGWWPEIHRGVDLAVPTGTPVHAMTDGTVEFAGIMGGYGLAVILRHNGHLRTLYAHLSELQVKTGAEVSDRQVIALSGASGNASGPHLHFEVLRWGRVEDPVPLLGGPFR